MTSSVSDRADHYRWVPWLAFVGLVLVAALSLRVDFARRAAVAVISEQGSPPPPVDVRSPTGYANGQRHFLGAQERGETFRWIAATQEMLATGRVSPTYLSDNTPEGRPLLLPRLYAAWLGSLAWIDHTLTGRSIGLAVENVALWEPILAHFVALALVCTALTRRLDWRSGVIGGVFLCLLPAFAEQYLPGVLSPRPWALLLAGSALALSFRWAEPVETGSPRQKGRSVAAGISTGLALGLDPAIGFPVVLVTAVAGISLALFHRGASPWLRWASAGAVTVIGLWWLDQGPTALAPGELRYVHPFYAFAWLGLGLLLHGIQTWFVAPQQRRRAATTSLFGAAIVAVAVVVQVRSGLLGWLYPAVTLLHRSSLSEALPPVTNVFAGLRAGPPADWWFLLTPALVAAAMLGAAAWSVRRTAWLPGILFLFGLSLGLLVLAGFRVRWWVFVSILSVPLIAFAWPALSGRLQRIALGVIACSLAALALWRAPVLLAAKPIAAEPAAADVEAMVFRHFSYWLAEHTPPNSVSALATPALSDALVYHGGSRVLMSTAWESHPGLVATSRVLSAPDWNEVEGILQRRGITHVVINSWDKVLAQFVRAPEEHRNETFHAKIQRWVFPHYLRPMPYHLPASAGFDGQVIAVLRVTAPQDEGLALSRLAEYFVEMERDYLANAAARILGQNHADEPNAIIARALVLHQARDRAGFEREVARLVEKSAPATVRLDWDRRVQRAIVYALGGRREVARSEIVACAATLTSDNLRELTPLQTFRFLKLVDSYGAALPTRELRQLAEAQCAEYAPKKEP